MGKKDESTIEIVDLNGKLLWSTQINRSRTIFNTINLANGNYLVKITSKLNGKSKWAQLTFLH